MILCLICISQNHYHGHLLAAISNTFNYRASISTITSFPRDNEADNKSFFNSFRKEWSLSS